MKYLVTSTAIALVLASSSGWAAQSASNTASSNPATANPVSQAASAQPQQPATVQVMAANQIVGRALKDSQGKDAGQINSLVIDTKNGAVDFVLIGSGGSLNLGGQLVAVPWLALQTPPAGNGPIVAKVSVAKLSQAPRIFPGRLYELSQRLQRERVYGYYGYRYPPYDRYGYGYGYAAGAVGGYRGRPPPASAVGAAGGGAAGHALASRPTAPVPQAQAANQNGQTGKGGTGQGGQTGGDTLLVAQNGAVATLEQRKTASSKALQNATVYAPNGDDVGDIDEVMIDVQRGEVAYVLLSRGGFLGINQTWSAVPVEALARAPYRGGYRLTVDEQVLNKEPHLHIDRQNLPSRVSTAQLATLYSHFKIPPYWQQGSQNTGKNPQTTASQSQSGSTQ